MTVKAIRDELTGLSDRMAYLMAMLDKAGVPRCVSHALFYEGLITHSSLPGRPGSRFILLRHLVVFSLGPRVPYCYANYVTSPFPLVLFPTVLFVDRIPFNVIDFARNLTPPTNTNPAALSLGAG